MRLDVDACDTRGTGTGFLVGPSLVATVAHVVEHARRVRVTAPALGRATAGTVVGLDHDHDLALIRTSQPLDGHIFTLRADQPPIGTEVGLIGFPLGRSMQLTVGHITDTHDRRAVGGEGFNVELSDVLLTDAAQNPGNSGGPWLTPDGTVVALAESGPPSLNAGDQPSAPAQLAQGNNGGVPASDAIARITRWKADPKAFPGCGAAVQSDESAALETLDYYLEDINNSDYDSAYAQLDPRVHPRSGLSNFIEGVKTSQDAAADGDPVHGPLYQLVAVAVARTGDRITADVRFRSRQDADHGPDGLICTDWHLLYEFRQVADLWLIRRTSALPGEARYTACADQSEMASSEPSAAPS